ncbi:hypothetical protein MA16_Dca020891 [Dendrobium catenatum]|uniref:Uncharacterized protein n=1 Tax=Dendrobium catenatum TaxID=906689 RepID=A0A2I0VN20_9ASPA|nr:hypothetical protein MA16_Dca020891 [Dendrobium catenatum]
MEVITAMLNLVGVDRNVSLTVVNARILKIFRSLPALSVIPLLLIPSTSISSNAEPTVPQTWANQLSTCLHRRPPATLH